MAYRGRLMETLDLEYSLDLEHWVQITKSGFMIKISLDLVQSPDLETSTMATETGF